MAEETQKNQEENANPSAPEKPEEVKEKPKAKKTKEIPKKEEAVARGVNLHASKKQCVYICTFIKNKPIDRAIADLQSVIALKKAVPFKGEIPHRKGDIMSGRYPVKAAGYFINLLKALKGNALVNGLEIDKTRITTASANWASRPQRRGGTAAKRTHILLKAREFSEGEKLK